jgi:hypothetical protein
MRFLSQSLAIASLPLVLAGCASHHNTVYETYQPAPASEVVYVSQPPPPVIVERRWAPPSPQHVWIPGHYVWNGGAYVWFGGYYEYPPHPHAVYHPAHWQHKSGGWVLIEGHF